MFSSRTQQSKLRTGEVLTSFSINLQSCKEESRRRKFSYTSGQFQNQLESEDGAEEVPVESASEQTEASQDDGQQTPGNTAQATVGR